MIIGIPKELKTGETRVSMTPNLCRRCSDLGATVYIEQSAGLKSGFTDLEYQEAGATISECPARVWDLADLIIKVKEPIPEEYPFLRRGQALFTYLHLAACPELSRVLWSKQVLAVAYEAVEGPQSSLPLLKPMSQIAGRLAVQIGAFYLQTQNGGSGVLLGGVPGTAPGNVVVIGVGNSGAHAVRMAVGMGARVTAIDRDVTALEMIEAQYSGRVITLQANPSNIHDAAARADLLVGAVLIPSARAPVVVTRAVVQAMRPGSAIIDIAIDQGGCIETIHPTSHSDPVYKEHNILHYAVPNMPALVGRTSTISLTQATEPYILQFAEKGVPEALRANRGLAKGSQGTPHEYTTLVKHS